MVEQGRAPRSGATQCARRRPRFAATVALLLAALVLPALTAAQTLPLWEVSKGGRSAYLLGTLHVGQPHWFPLPPPMRQAYEWAEAIGVEVDGTKPETRQAIARTSVLPAGSQLDTAIGAAAWQKLVPIINAARLPVDEARRMKPWMLASVLTVGAHADAGFLPDLAIDGALVRVAVANGKPLVELERFGDQAALLDELSQKHGAAWLVRVADQVASGKARRNIEQLADAWRAGDLEQVQKVVEEEVVGDAAALEIHTRIARSRGANIASRISAVLDEGRRMAFAVHIANLAGPDGVVARLGSDGFRVRQLTLNSEVAPAAPEKPVAAAGARSGRDGSSPSPASQPSGSTSRAVPGQGGERRLPAP